MTSECCDFASRRGGRLHTWMNWRMNYHFIIHHFKINDNQLLTLKYNEILEINNIERINKELI